MKLTLEVLIIISTAQIGEIAEIGAGDSVLFY